MLHSDKIPNIPFKITSSHMSDLFRNFAYNWHTLSPVTYLLFGILLAFFVLTIMKHQIFDGFYSGIDLLPKVKQKVKDFNVHEHYWNK